MKYWMFVLILFAGSASASIIQYDYTFKMVKDEPREDRGWLTVTTLVDSTAQTFLDASATYSFEGSTFYIPGTGNYGGGVDHHVTMPFWHGYFGFALETESGNRGHIDWYQEIGGTIEDNPYENLDSFLDAYIVFYVRGITDGEIIANYGCTGCLSITKTYIDTAAEAPEPTTLALLGLGLAGLVRRRG